MLNPDYHDMLSALCEEGADFLVVGAFALAAHGLPRATGDIDIWIRATGENAARVWRALQRFGAATLDLTIDDLSRPDVVFQIGLAPRRIDILTSIDGVTFDEAWPAREVTAIEGLSIPVIGRQQFIQNKRAAGRPQDLADIRRLEHEPS